MPSTAHPPTPSHLAGDGQLDIGLPTYDGAIVFYAADGRELPLKLQVPRLAVTKARACPHPAPPRPLPAALRPADLRP